jgi:hypothetical protein
MAVDAETIVWLKEGVLWSPTTDAGVASAFGNDALETDIVSCLALASDAAVESARQQGFLEGPLAVEVLTGIKGQRADLIGRPVTITCDRLGYNSGLTVFVIDVQEQEGTDRTTLKVLRRL